MRGSAVQVYVPETQEPLRRPWPCLSCFIVEGAWYALAVSLTVDVWKSRDALRRAESIDPASIPSRERRGRLYVEMARGHHVAEERFASTRLLLLACDEGVDSVRYSPAARDIVADLNANSPRAIRDDVRGLIARLGLDLP